MNRFCFFLWPLSNNLCFSYVMSVQQYYFFWTNLKSCSKGRLEFCQQQMDQFFSVVTVSITRWSLSLATRLHGLAHKYAQAYKQRHLKWISKKNEISWNTQIQRGLALKSSRDVLIKVAFVVVGATTFTQRLTEFRRLETRRRQKITLDQSERSAGQTERFTVR